MNKILFLTVIPLMFLIPNVYAQTATTPEPCIDVFGEGFELVRAFAELLPDGTQQSCVRVLDLVCDNEQIGYTIHFEIIPVPVEGTCTGDTAFQEFTRETVVFNIAFGNQVIIKEPRPIICPAEFQPVCGVDIETYSNACQAFVADVEVLHLGACVVSAITEEQAKFITQELGFEEIQVSALVITRDGKGNSFTTRSEPSFLTGVIGARTPLASIIQQEDQKFGTGGLDVTDGGLRILLEFKSNSITNDPVTISGFITVHSTYRDTEDFPLCFDQLVVDENAVIDFESHLQAFERCIQAQPSLEQLIESGDYLSSDKEFAFVGKSNRQDGVIVFEIFDERYDDVLALANPFLFNGEYFLIVDLGQLTFTANNISYFLNFVEVPVRTDLDFITFRDPFLIAGFDVNRPISDLIPELEIEIPEIILTKQTVDEIATPIPIRDDLVIVADDFIEEKPSFFQPIIEFFEGIGEFFRGLFGGN